MGNYFGVSTLKIEYQNTDTWRNGLTKPGISSENDESQMINSIQNIFDEYFLEKLIDLPTHKDGNLLDLLFTNNTEILHSFSYDETMNSDHYLVSCKTNYIHKQVNNQSHT